MEQHGTPLAGEILGQIRKAKGYSQDEVADSISCSQSTLSRLERGDPDSFDVELVRDYKVFLGVEFVPLVPSERQGFRGKLHTWLDTIIQKDFENAERIQPQLAAIVYLPHEVELNIFYELFACRLHIERWEYEAANQALAALEGKQHAFTDLHHYHYHYNKGTLCGNQKQFEEAFDHYMTAFNFMKNGLQVDMGIYYNLAFCCYELGRVAKTVMFLEKAQEFYGEADTSALKSFMDNLLAVSYIKIGYLPGAKRLLDKCLAQAKLNDSPNDIGMILINYAYLYRKAGKVADALDYLGRAESYVNKESVFYLEMLYQKAWCYLEMDYPVACKKVVDEGKKLSEGNEELSTYFKALECVLSPDTKASRAYLDTVALPYFLEKNLNHMALEFCDFLLEAYRKQGKGFQARVGRMAEITADVRKVMLEGGVLD